MPPNIKISQIRCFAAVVENGGFKAAAQSLCRSQPAISVAVKELEKQLGAQLFEPGSGSRPSHYGLTFYEIARHLLSEYDRSLAQAIDTANGKKGTLRLMAVPSFARSVLPVAIKRFVADFPDVEIHISDGHTESIRNAVLAGQADFGFCGHIAPDPRLRFQELHRDTMGVICSQHHPLARHASLDWKRLEGERLIGNGTMNLITGPARRYIEHASHFFVPTTTSLLAMVEAGIGITILPELIFPARNSGSMTFVPLTGPTITRKLGLLTLSNRQLSPTSKVFYQYVAAILEQRSGGARRPRSSAARK